MDIFLMQHGASISGEIDPQRPLSSLGAEQCARSARAMRAMGLGFDALLCSPKLRALETARIVAETLGFRREAVRQTERLIPKARPDATLDLLAEYANEATLLLIGHLPNLADLASLLLSAGNKVALGFENAGLTFLHADECAPGKGILGWHLSPYHLQFIARA